ncbi:hypothetical protein JB92DRAFT_651941 [Gautieria morchelliformis]|nr:hypothetical protein JB92DRAFT_651941 [Gautieria morchelliformis]
MHATLRILSRSAWKGPYFVNFPALRDSMRNNIVIKTQARACAILPTFVGLRFAVHNGKEYIQMTITQDMVGHKLGEFAMTRKKFHYKPSKNK